MSSTLSLLWHPSLSQAVKSALKCGAQHWTILGPETSVVGLIFGDRLEQFPGGQVAVAPEGFTCFAVAPENSEDGDLQQPSLRVVRRQRETAFRPIQRFRFPAEDL